MSVKKRLILEEIGNSVTHGVGLLLVFVGIIVFFISHQHLQALQLLSASIFFFAATFVYCMSTLFHSLAFTRAKKVFAILDQSAIFLLIAGTYTPFLLLSLKGTMSLLFLSFIWLITILGIIMKSIFLEASQKISVIMYLLLGWSVLLISKPIIASISPQILFLLLLGGLFYSSGVFFYRAKQLPFNHMIWHIFVLFGSICHYLAIAAFL